MFRAWPARIDDDAPKGNIFKKISKVGYKGQLGLRTEQEMECVIYIECFCFE